jgi:hypothetical protein
MKIDAAAVRKCLKDFDFQTLFREHLGWDNHKASLSVAVGEEIFDLTAVAQKRGFVAFVCPGVPDRPTRIKIDHKVTKSVREHFVIYTDQAAGRQVWHWVRREPGKPAASRDHRFDAAQSGDPLIQRLDQIAVCMEEEEGITLPDVSNRFRAAFDADKVTKKFYDRFKNEHAAFLKLVKGLKSDTDLAWYTSLMMNRLMFVYFIQKKSFLDGDTDYLKNRLTMVQKLRGKDRFQTFYRYFLLRLFHEGLGLSPDERHLDSEMERLLGRVPFLNGGFFEVHQLEAQNPEIDIPDKAFEKLFAFFEQYRWHLDDRPLRADNEINPDVVGYIFEKYINQKQMGAYYTKEDITEYISKNTLIPFLFDAAEKKCPIAFKPDGFLWKLLREDPDRYIYPAVRHGVVKKDGAIVPETELPDFVQTGMHDPKARMFDKRYNLQQAPAGDPLRLVTETWREYVYRRNRCLEIREKLQNGEVHQINDLITLNLDIWQFARDAIVTSEGPELLRAFWQAIVKVSVLDPTCGSGAFLFAALRILESLYSDCLERMERFIEDIQDKPHHPKLFSDFKEVLAQIAKHPNERYFILKSAILNNLYGVDIMAEAVEICKLRLFLKLVAQVEQVEQIEPLPDMDFNIRTGNSLVGYATEEQARKAFREKDAGNQKQGMLPFGETIDAYRRFEEELFIVERAFRQFREQQAIHGGKVSHKDKIDLRKRLAKLDGELDIYLALECGVVEKIKSENVISSTSFKKWKNSHQPFHWFVEFYGIMNSGGFDVIIGNPPYLELRQVDYCPKGFLCNNSAAIHAMCIERSICLLKSNGCMSMIVPMALPSTQRMQIVQKILEKNYNTWYANYAWRPGKLFDTVNRALTVFVITPSTEGLTFSTNYQKWTSEDRDGLFERLRYVNIQRERSEFWAPKICEKIENNILEKSFSIKTKVKHFIGTSNQRVYYRTTGGLYWKVFTDFAPAFKLNGKYGHSSRETFFAVANCGQTKPLVAVLSSNYFWWWYTITSNLRDLNPYDVQNFPVPEPALNDRDVIELGAKYLKDIDNNSCWLVREQKQTGRAETQSFKIQKSKSIIDQIDQALAKHYGFTDEELDFIINYDIKYRMGRAVENGGEAEP